MSDALYIARHPETNIVYAVHTIKHSSSPERTRAEIQRVYRRMLQYNSPNLKEGGTIFDYTFPAAVETDSTIVLTLVDEKQNIAIEFEHRSGQSFGSTYYFYKERR